MNHNLRNFLALVGMVIAVPAFAGHGNIEAGKQLAQQKNCASCHGADGNTPVSPEFPRLAGQHPEYLAKALRDYKGGKRKDPVMGGQAKDLTNQNIADLTAYYGSLQGALKLKR